MSSQLPSSGHDTLAGADPSGAPDELSPLTGEAGPSDVSAPRKQPVSLKGLLAVVLLFAAVLLAAMWAVQRYVASFAKPDAEDSKLVRERPTAATTEPPKLQLATAPSASAPERPAPRIPALVPTEEELAEPIGVHRTGTTATGSSGSSGTKPMPPEDAPVLLVSSRPGQGSATTTAHVVEEPQGAGAASDPVADQRDPLATTSRNLQGYQRQLQGLLDNLTRTAELARNGGPATATAAAGEPAPPPTVSASISPSISPSASSSTAGLLGGQLLRSATPKVTATTLGNRSLTLPKGTAFTCALKSRVVTASSGMVGCTVQRNVYGDDGRVLLIERGSHLDGEYRITAVRPGTVRIPVLWTRVRTPLGVTVDLDSPATGQLGEAGIDGHVDNRWKERIGAAMLLSLIDDSVKLIIQQQSNDRQGGTVVLPSTTANGSKLAEKVLDSTINIPPLIYQNQGGIVGIYVAGDIDFSGVYKLVPTVEGPTALSQ